MSERTAVFIGCAAGVAAALSPASPTGQPAIDGVLVGTSTAAVVYAAASAPWWTLVLAAGAAVAVSSQPVLIVLAVLALLGALWIGTRRRSNPELRAVSAGLAVNVLARSELDGFLGLTAIVAIAAGALIFLAGIRRRPRPIRRIAWAATGSVAVLAVLFAAGLGLAVAQSRADLVEGRRLVESGIVALNEGDFSGATTQFEEAAAALQRADGDLRRPWALGAAVVPVLAQHRRAAVELSASGSAAAETVAQALDTIDPASLRATAGRIDLDAVAALRQPFRDVEIALDKMASAIDDSRSPWLVTPADEQLDVLAQRVAENGPRLDNAVTAVDLAPDLLGANGTRTYLALFTTPSEARGLGGLPGNYAELTVTDGQIDMTDFGRVLDLEQAALAAGARIEGPEEFLAQYGAYGFDEDGNGLVGGASFRNVTMSPHFPYVADVVSQLYPQATGRSIDGVIVLDPYVVQALLGYTGPIQLTTVDRELTVESAAEFLLRDQYLYGAGDNEQRIDALEEAAELTFSALLAGTLPEPTALARDLGELVAQRRLLFWSADREEQELLRAVGLLGEIPPHAGADGWSVAVSNGSGNKIDSFLVRSASYESARNEATGETTAVLRIALTNTAPPSGLPDYVIGNLVGLPTGSSRLIVSCYSPLALTAATLDGQPTELSPGEEQGWNVYTRTVDIGPGATATLELTLTGALDRPADLVMWEQPLVLPLQVAGQDSPVLAEG